MRYATEAWPGLTAEVAGLRKTLLAGDLDLPVIKVTSFAKLIDVHAPLWIARSSAVLLGTFGATALLLAVIGLYGVKAYAVARRTREIGIRLALGGSPRAAFNLILRQAALQIALALSAGMLLALGAGRFVGSLLYQVGGSDPLSLFIVAFVLGASGLAACCLPARRATRVDPTIALRCD